MAAGSAGLPPAASEMTIVPSDSMPMNRRVSACPNSAASATTKMIADKCQLERRDRNRRRDDEHDETDLLRLLDRRAEADDGERAEQTEGERKRELDRDEDRRNRDAEQRKGAVHLAAGGPVGIEVHVKI